jgi:hypothetical protein
MRIFAPLILVWIFVMSAAAVSAQDGGQADGDGRGKTTVIFQDFDNGVLPPGWQIIDGQDDGYTWKLTDVQYYGLGLPFEDTIVVINSKLSPNADMDEMLVSAYYYCSNLVDVHLSFTNYFNFYPPGPVEVGDVDVRNGAGGTWYNVLHMTNMNYGPQEADVNITPYIGDGDSVQVRFHYYNAMNDNWWLIDNFKLYYDCEDPDNDNICSQFDNCPYNYNPNQYDYDGDGIGYVCDTCVDMDADGYGNPGFVVNTCPNDNCPSIYNPDQADRDNDGIGDSCDACTDSDGDGFGNPGYPYNTCATDNCPGVFNPHQFDSDGDGEGDLCDDCTDPDGDSFGSPGYPATTCMIDNCPDVYNPEQFDLDDDGIGDVCDDCTDTDGDGFGNPGFSGNQCAEDNCPDMANEDQADADGDGIGDACDECTDIDGDGFGDPGFSGNTCELDNCPDIYNPDQLDSDADGIGDVCDECTDTDGDEFGDPGFEANTCEPDNCPDVYNPGQEDADQDGAGDLCDICPNHSADDCCNPIGENDPPELISANEVILAPGEDFVYEISATDPDCDGSELETWFEYYPAWCHVDGDSIFGTAECETSDSSFMVIISDGTLEDTAIVQLFIDLSNQPPEITDTIQNVLIHDSLEFIYYPMIYDPDDTSYEIVYDLYPDWCMIVNDTLRGIVPVENSIQTVVVKVWDYCNSDSLQFSVQAFICGDANSDDAVNVSDAVAIINFVFLGGVAPEPYRCGDCNCDTSVNVSDAVCIINHVFLGGPKPCSGC